jgi:hypothetical protein
MWCSSIPIRGGAADICVPLIMDLKIFYILQDEDRIKTEGTADPFLKDNFLIIDMSDNTLDLHLNVYVSRNNITIEIRHRQTHISLQSELVPKLEQRHC